MPYGYKQPGNWKSIRRHILERDGHACYVCGAEATEVDALIPESQGGNHTDEDNLAAICTPHHKAKSDQERREGQRRQGKRGARPVEQHPGLISPGA